MFKNLGVTCFFTGEQTRGIARTDLMLCKVKWYRLHELSHVNVKPRSLVIMIGLANCVNLPNH